MPVLDLTAGALQCSFLNASNLPDKLRIFVRQETNGTPAAGLPLTAMLGAVFSLRNPATPGSSVSVPCDIAVGVLASDHAGYLSFDLRRIRQAFEDMRSAFGLQTTSQTPFLDVEVRSIRVHSPILPDSACELLTASDDSPHEDVKALSDLVHRSVRGAASQPFVIRVGASRADHHPLPTFPRLPSIQNPDVEDWLLSPDSFGTAALPTIGEGGCEEILPSRVETRLERFYRLIRTPRALPLTITAATRPGRSDFASGVLPYKLAQLSEVTTRWHLINHGLGEIDYSLTLAPGEGTRIAVVDWARTDEGSRRESTGLTESLSHALHRDRTLDEVLDATVREFQKGESFLGGTAGVGGYGSQGGGQGSGMGGVTGSHALGWGTASSEGLRETNAKTAQRLADAVAQAGHALRDLRSSVVAQVSQEERLNVQTRFVRNYNHSHALTILYYRIVRHYLVETEWTRSRIVLLIRRDPIEFSSDDVLCRHRHVLLEALLDEKHRPALQAVGTETQAEHDAWFFGNATLQRLLVEIHTGIHSIGPDRLRVSLILRNGEIITLPAEMPRDGMLPSPIPHWHGFGAEPFGANTRWLFSFEERSPRTPTSLSISHVRPSDVVRAMLTFNSDQTENTWEASGLRIWGVFSDGGSDLRFLPIVDWKGPVTLNGDSDLLIDVLPRPVPIFAALQKMRALAELVEHLEQNRQHYQRAIWLKTDPGRWFATLEDFQWTEDGVVGTLADVLDPTPLAVFGDYVAHAVGEWKDAESETTQGEPQQYRRIVSLPTRGTFAESRLSHCNASEVIDDTRFWDWQTSPIPDEPPEILPVDTGSRARDLSLAPSGLPGGTLGIAQAPDAPASVLAHVLDSVMKSDVFRDMSKAAELAGVLQELTKAAASVEGERIKGITQLDTNRTNLEQARLGARQANQNTVGQASAAPVAQPARSQPSDGTAIPEQPSVPSEPGTAPSASPREGQAQRSYVERNVANPTERAARLRTVDDRVAPTRGETQTLTLEIVDQRGRPVRGLYALAVVNNDPGPTIPSAGNVGVEPTVRVPGIHRDVVSVQLVLRADQLQVVDLTNVEAVAGALWSGETTRMTASRAVDLRDLGARTLAILDASDPRSYLFHAVLGAQERVFTVSTEVELAARLEASLGANILEILRLGEVSASTGGHVGAAGSVQLSTYVLDGSVTIHQGPPPRRS